MTYLQPIFENIPDAIKSLPQFVNWKAEQREGKITKPPHKPGGDYAKSDDPLSWSTFEACRDASNKFDGIGFVLTSNDQNIALDFDKCRCPAFDLIDPAIEQHIKDLNSYTEISPSGRGIRVLLKGSLPVSGRKNGSCEIYSSGRYVTLTGHVLPGYPLTIENRQAEIDRFYKEVFPEKNISPMGEKHLAQSFIPDDRLKKALASKTGAEIQKLLDGDFSAYPSQSEADLSLCNHLAFWFNGDEIAIDKTFRESKLYREKWDRKHFGSGETYGQHTINQAVKGCKNFYSALPRIERNISPIGEKAPPVTEKTTDTLTFPDIMSGLAGEFADLYSSYMEAPAHFFYIAFLTCIGSFLNIELASELKTQPRLFVILLGQSADDKKSTAINKTVKFFQDVMTEFRICLGVGSAEGLQKVLKESSHVLLCLDEFRQLISKCKIEGSVLLPFINTLFESNRYEAQTKTATIYLDDAHLSLLAASTIQTYERTWDASFTDIGFNNRIFIVPGSGEKKHSFPLEIPELERVLLQKKLDDILQFVGSGLKVNITPKARELYHQWYMNLDRSIHAKRLDTYALRFMMLLTVNEMKKDIDKDIVHKVTQLMDWQLQVRRLHDPIDADSAIAKIEEKIRRILLIGAKSEHDLKRGVHVDRTGLWPFLQALKNLSTGKEIAWDKANKTYLIVSEK